MNDRVTRLNPGFSLVELLVSMAVLAMLMTVALPAYTAMLTNHRLATQANSFLNALHLARSEAIKRNVRVALCKSSTGEHCADAGGWQQGWIVFEDANNNGLRDEAETLIMRAPPLKAGFVMTGNSPVAEYVSYTPMGLTKMSSDAFQAGTITLCPPAGKINSARQVIISITGRPRIAKGAAILCS